LIWEIEKVVLGILGFKGEIKLLEIKENEKKEKKKMKEKIT
jgi:hypothetical protein